MALPHGSFVPPSHQPHADACVLDVVPPVEPPALHKATALPAHRARILRKSGTPVYRRLPPKPELVANHNYYVSYPCLDAVGVIFHTDLLLVKCFHCASYIASDHVFGHMRDQHKILLGPAEIKLAVEFLNACQVYHTPEEARPPAPNGPPVQGLDIVMGIACEESDCAYCCVDSDTMTKHLRKKHRSSYDGEPRHKVSLQTLFRVPIVYFRVNPALATSGSPDLVSALSDTFMEEATQPPPHLTAERDGDSTPLHEVLGFDDLLLSIRKSRESTQHLVSLKKRHTPEEDGGIYERLSRVATVWAGMVPEMLKGNAVQLDLTRVIIYGPAHMPHGTYVLLPSFSSSIT